MTSLQRQLRRGMLVTLLVAMAALLVLVNVGVERLTRDYVTSRLQHDAESLIASLDKAADGQWSLDTARLSTVYDRVRSGHYYFVRVGDQQFRSRSLWDEAIDVDPLAPGRSRDVVRAGPGDEQWLVRALGIRKQGDALTVWVAEDIHPLQVARYTYSAWALVLVAGTLLLLLAVQQWLLKRGFRKLDKVRESIRDLRGGREGALERDMPAEVQPLVEEIDRLLGQLYQRVMRSRNALGNLAHELKRPMQRLTMLIEDVESDRREELDAALRDIRRLLDRELKRARIVGVSSPGRQMDVCRDLSPLLDVLRKLYPAQTITARYPPDLVLPQDRDDLLELFGNLLDNACKFADGNVRLSIEATPDGALIIIADDGPGVAGDQLATLTRRGMRHDESMAGAGLGLAICQDICDSYGGELSFANRPEGGLEVRVFLPHDIHGPAARQSTGEWPRQPQQIVSGYPPHT